VRALVIGVRNSAGLTRSVEVWVNELRLTDFDERGGWAANGSLSVALSDLGTIQAAGRITTAGFGQIDQSIGERSQGNLTQDAASTPTRLRSRFATKPDPDTLFDALAALTHEIRRFGLFNFVMSNGDNLFAHASTLLHYIVRKAPFGKARLLDDDVMVDFSEVTPPNDKVAVIATLPLTRDETWSQLAVDELVMFRQGDIARSDRPEQPVYMSVEEGLAIARAVGVSV